MDTFVDSPVLAGHWYAVARSSEVSPGPAKVTLLGSDYVVWRDPDGQLTAAPDRCPHREAPLSAGWVTDGCVVCPYHGFTFETGGRCVRVPSSPEGSKIPPKAHLSTVHVTDRYGLVWICPGEPTVGIPDIPQELDDSYRRINNPVEVWQTSATRMVDNFLDISHFPFVHTGTFGEGTETVVPKIELEELPDGFYGYAYDVTVNNPQSASAASAAKATTKVLTRHMSSGFILPFVCRSTIRYETGMDHILLLLSTPVDDVTSYFTFVVWRNDDFSAPADEIVAFDRAIGAEDKAMLEQLDGVLPFDQQATVSVQSDKPSVEWRRRFVKLLAGD
ncbi:MAG: aromatic ring-hydroxylating dioxygenase subunit alpha [Acidimicrobiales bacterium]